MQLFADEMIEDKLDLIELGFNKFQIQGLIRNDIFFIGIFQHFPDSETVIHKNYLNIIAEAFLDNYKIEDIQDNFVSHERFAQFTDEIIRISNGQMNPKHCRNCLTKCTSENKHCLPHNFYFEEIESSQDIIKLKENKK